MTIAMADDHPVRAFEKEARFYRVQWLFTPTGETQLALHEIERMLGPAIKGTPHPGAFFPVGNFGDQAPRVKMSIRSGWVFVEATSTRAARTRIGVSRYGQVALSVSEPVATSPAQTYQAVEPHFLRLGAILFGRIVSFVAGAHAVGVGTVECSLSDLKDDAKPFRWPDTLKQASEDVVDARWGHCDPASSASVATAIAQCICELAIYFRDEHGGKALLLAEEVKELKGHMFTP